MKRGKILLTILIGLFLINFASAYYSYSLSDMLNEFDASTVFLVAIFIVLFAFVNYSTSKMFKDNKATGGIVAFCVSFLAVYGINKTGFDFENIFYNLGYSLGLSEDLIYTIIVLLVIAGLAYLFFFWQHRRQAPYLVGFLMIIASFFTYESASLIILGVILIIIGWFMNRGPSNPNRSRRTHHYVGQGGGI
ncbi:hypothetical protein GOV13_04150 [Candidatus Pacearchaeota archaeon]|nr:hypothetical protein [Candidatus Pacearchaeota archaeon]